MALDAQCSQQYRGYQNTQEQEGHRLWVQCLMTVAPREESSESHKGLSPCDFHLIPKMKEPLRGIRFRTVPEILQAVDSSIQTINTTGAAKGILRLPHRWQRVVHNAGDYIEGK